MSFCRNCGQEIPDNSKFCPSCGTPVIKTKKSTKEKPDIEPEQANLGGTALHTNLVYGKINIENLPENFEIDNRYIVKQKLGQGSFGAVYRVFDKDLETEKALKIIPEAISNDHEAMMSLRKEAAIMVKLNHPHIVRVYDFHHTGDIKYIDMEYVQGENLADIKLKKPEHKFIEKEVRDYALQIIEALAYAHNKKVIHKDIKPQNIMLNNSGEIKLMDFGIAETVHSSMSRLKNTGSSGTLVYMSPEQLRGKDVGREADIYSLGATLYELLSGNPPFYQGDITYQIINEQVADLNHVSKNINAIIQKCLAKDKAKRFSDCDELRKAFLDEKTIENEIKEEEIITEEEIIEPQQTQDKTTTIQKKKKSYDWLIIFLSTIVLFGIVYNNNKREQEIIRQQEIEQQQLEQEQKAKEEAERLAEQKRQEEIENIPTNNIHKKTIPLDEFISKYLQSPIEDVEQTSIENMGPELINVGDDFGKSKYDIGMTKDQALDLYESRAQRQTNADKLANGLIKGSGFAATTFATTFTSLPYGILNTIETGDVSKIYDNGISREYNKFNKALEKAFPNYYTRNEDEASAFSTTNIFSMNFLSDKLIKCIGFTIGAIASGSLLAKVLIPQVLKAIIYLLKALVGTTYKNL